MSGKVGSLRAIEDTQRHLEDIRGLIEKLNRGNPDSAEWRNDIDKAVRIILIQEYRRVSRELGS